MRLRTLNADEWDEEWTSITEDEWRDRDLTCESEAEFW